MAKYVAALLALLVFAVFVNAAELFETGEALVKEGKVDEALKLYQGELKAKIVDSDPALVGQVARLLYENQDYKATLKFVAEALDAGVKHPFLNYYRARVAFDHRDELNVADDLDVVLAAIPEHIGATILKGMYLRSTIAEDEEKHVTGEQAEKDEEVKAESERLMKLGLSYSPVTADDYEQQAAAYMYEQDLENSARLTQAAIALNPARPPLFLIRCLILVSQDDVDGGLVDCKKAHSLSKVGPIKEAIESVLELIEYAKAAQDGEVHEHDHDEDDHPLHSHGDHDDGDGGCGHSHDHDDDEGHGHGHAHEHHEGCGHSHNDL